VKGPVQSPPSAAGYSATPLAKKLGISEGSTVALVGAPASFTVPHLPPGVVIRRSSRLPSDVTLWFVKSAVELAERISEMAKRADRSALWICWPKRASGVRTDVTEHLVRSTGIESGLVDFKIGAIDDTWSGLRFSISSDRTVRGRA
jgi:hypothetical protein